VGNGSYFPPLGERVVPAYWLSNNEPLQASRLPNVSNPLFFNEGGFSFEEKVKDYGRIDK
jgi:hypothetical protein